MPPPYVVFVQKDNKGILFNCISQVTTYNYAKMFDDTCTLIPKPLVNMNIHFFMIFTVYLLNGSKTVHSTQLVWSACNM